MHKLLKLAILAALVAAVFIPAPVQAGDAPYLRKLITITSTASNGTWTVGRYERPTVFRMDAINIIPTGTAVTVTCTYGDALGGSTNWTSIVTTNVSPYHTAGSTTYTVPYKYLQADDVLTVSGPTSGTVRVHFLQRDTKSAN